MQEDNTVNELAEELSQLSTVDVDAPHIPEFTELSQGEMDVLAAAADTGAIAAAAFPPATIIRIGAAALTGQPRNAFDVINGNTFNNCTFTISVNNSSTST
ncbi:hypothetical protein HDU88_004020 [Geranomyces variabilis]|nr:hypothetical protein HDU88_004020 [Geranomyces variabilis]